MEDQPRFFTGGALPPTYVCYVPRRCDRTAIRAFDRGRLIYVIAPRQMGKTSLLKRVASRLGKQGWRCCFVDLATSKGLDQSRWFQHFGEELARSSGANLDVPVLRDQQDFRDFLFAHIGLGRPTPRVRLALFLDEIEGLLGLEFSDGFLMTLRDMYQQRDSYPGQMLIVFAGAVDPSVVVRDPAISPFNVAEEIVLDDFTASESLLLTSKLAEIKAGIEVLENAHSRIYEWTSGQPYLSQRICEIVEDWVETQHVAQITSDVVDQVVDTVLLTPRGLDKNVKHVLGELDGLGLFADALLKRLLAGEPVHATEAGFYSLYLTGLVTQTADRRVSVRNRIYAKALKEFGGGYSEGAGIASYSAAEVRNRVVSVLGDVGRWTVSELGERWKLVRQKKGEVEAIEIDFSEPKEQVDRGLEALLQEVAAERGIAEVERVLKLIERKRGLILEWKEMKLDNEKAFNRQELDRAAHRLKQRELDQKIAQAMAEIESDLKELGVKTQKDAEVPPDA